MSRLTIHFNHDSDHPLYYQLYRYLVEEIKQGHFAEQDKLPSKRSLSDHLKISLNTIDTAYQMLVTEGYVRAVPKSGFYVCRMEPSLPAAGHTTPIFQEKAEPQESYRYDFSTNTVDVDAFPYVTWAKITKEIMYHHRELLHHGHRQGDLCLRESIAKYLHESRGVLCSPSQLVVGAGMEYLLLILNELLGRDAVFAMENPGYPKAYQAIFNSGKPIVCVHVDENGMNLEHLRQSGANVAYITPSHQFPTGVVMPIGRRMELLHWAAEQPGRYLIEDDYDSEFKFSGRPIPALQGIAPTDQVIYIGTFSRSIAPSIRIAYMVLPHSLLDRYQKDFRSYSSTVSRFEQHTLHRFLQGGHLERHLNRSRNSYKKRREALIQELKNSPLGSCLQIRGANAGLHFLLQVYNGKTEAELIAAAKTAGIKTNGLSSYFLPEPPLVSTGPPTLILGYAQFSPDQIRDAAALLMQALA